MSKLAECPICGKQFKNVGVHMRHAHPTPSLELDDNLISDEKLSDIVLKIRELVNHYNNSFEVTLKDTGGIFEECNLSIKLRIRR